METLQKKIIWIPTTDMPSRDRLHEHVSELEAAASGSSSGSVPAAPINKWESVLEGSVPNSVISSVRTFFYELSLTCAEIDKAIGTEETDSYNHHRDAYIDKLGEIPDGFVLRNLIPILDGEKSIHGLAVSGFYKRSGGVLYTSSSSSICVNGYGTFLKALLADIQERLNN